MKIKKAVLSLCLAVVCVVSMETTIFAAETTEQSKSTNVSSTSTDVPANADASEVYNTYMETAKAMENNSDFDTVFDFYKSMETEYAKRYVKYCKGTEEEWKSKSRFEQFLWYELYINPIMCTQLENGYNTYFKSVDVYHSNVTNTMYSMLSRIDQTQADAFRTITDWQYNYFTQNGAVYNFVTGKTSLDENNELQKVTESEDTSSADPTQSEINDLVEQENGNKGVWSNTVIAIKNNALTIFILIVLVGALVTVIVRRKRKAIDDTDSKLK
ncbi:hypothetical protein OBV_p-00400 (plasmid) [Oscillibacter valericigenes Sjm18-20]|nr:hypothetical protein OBV_p-00400 [Oscillibacter valericigenes Sjm18-20]